MYRSVYYKELKALAAEKRAHYEIQTSHLGLREVREIYKAERITVDLWKLPATIRGVYMCDEDDPSVLINKNLPEEPRLFSMVHELKHHYCDRERTEKGQIRCGAYNANEVLEIGAEVFAAEFIYPEAEFLECVERLRIKPSACSKEQVVLLRRSCEAKVSHKFLQKRLERLGFIEPGAYRQVQFKKLEEALYGAPIYKQPWFRAARSCKKLRRWKTSSTKSTTGLSSR